MPRTPEQLLEAARSLRPKAAAASEWIERERRLPDDLARELREAGLFGMGIPTAVGGSAAAVQIQMEVIEELAAGDGSTGWLVMAATQIGGGISTLELGVQREMFEAGVDHIVAGHAAALGTVTQVEGGLQLRGSWQFASGCQYSKWMYAGFTVDRDGAPRRGLAFFPAEQARVIDTWHTLGLRGTGSHDFELDAVVVPWARTFFNPVRAALGHPDLLYRINTANLPLVCSQSAQALGMARGALAAFKELFASKRSRMTGAALASETWAHEALGLAEARLFAARTAAYAAASEAWAHAVADTEIPLEDRARIRLTMVHSARTAGEVIDGLYEAAGSDGLFDSSPLGRYFRDWRTAKSHIVISPATYATAGRLIAGVDQGPLLW